MKILIDKLDDGGYEVSDVQDKEATERVRKERVINVLELEESLLRHGLSEAEVARAVKQIEQQASTILTIN